MAPDIKLPMEPAIAPTDAQPKDIAKEVQAVVDFQVIPEQLQAISAAHAQITATAAPPMHAMLPLIRPANVNAQEEAIKQINAMPISLPAKIPKNDSGEP